MKTMMQLTFYVIGGVLGWFLGGFDEGIYTLVVFVFIDYLTGLTCAALAKRVSSDVGFKGIARKISIFLLIGMSNLIDIHVLKHAGVIRGMVIFFYIANEGISILENTTYLGLPIPQKLRDMLIQLQDEGDLRGKKNK